jgi:hypothetical protein
MRGIEVMPSPEVMQVSTVPGRLAQDASTWCGGHSGCASVPVCEGQELRGFGHKAGRVTGSSRVPVKKYLDRQ